MNLSAQIGLDGGQMQKSGHVLVESSIHMQCLWRAFNILVTLVTITVCFVSSQLKKAYSVACVKILSVGTLFWNVGYV
jgi:hypothetical protein